MDPCDCCPPNEEPQHHAKVRFTITTPDDLIQFQTVDFTWPVGKPVDFVAALKPLVEWIGDVFRPWNG